MVAGAAVGGAGVDPATAVHIKPVGDDAANATTTIRLVHALSELGAENVGPGIVAKLYAAGLRTIGAIYAASAADFAKLDGIKAKGAERIHVGLRAAEKSWTTLTFLVASSTMPRGVGHTKLTPLLALNPNPATWSAAELKAAKPAGLSPATIDAVVAAVPAFQAWIAETGLAVAGGGGAAAAAVTAVTAVPAAAAAPDHQMTVVFTGVRDKALEATLQSMGHIVADAVTKKTTHVIYADDAAGETTKVAKAKSLGIPTQTLSEFKANLGL
jgi:NAD-dependent DNA ligase